MIKNYFKTALRSLKRNKTSTFIHITGLGIGVVSTLLIFFYVDFEHSYEKMHVNAERIYRLTIDMYDGNEFVVNDSQTYQLLGPEFTATYPEVENYVRMFPLEPIEIEAVSTNFKSYEERVYFSDESIFDVFTLPLLDDRNIAQFKEPFKVIVSESTAIKYFGKTAIIGEFFQVAETENPLEIIGVFQDLPMNTHIKYDILISHKTLPQVFDWYPKNAWNANNEYTFLLMKVGADLDDFNEKLVQYSEKSEQINEEIIIAERIQDIHLYSNKTYEPEVNGSAQTVNFLLFIGIMIIVLAWINYINLATAKAMERAKEVGIRKAMGSSKSQLMMQFFAESFLTNLVAILLASLVFILVLPSFREFIGTEIAISNFGFGKMVLLLCAFVVLGTLVSGFYPAMVLSGFNPVLVLKGRFANTSKGLLLRRSLVYVQFIASVVMLCVSFAVFRQMRHLTSQDLGIEIDNTLVVKVPQMPEGDDKTASMISTFESRLSPFPWVRDITLSGVLPGSNTKDMSSSSGVRREGEDEGSSGSLVYYHYGVKANYPEVMGLEFLAGSPFSEESPLEMILISEKAMENLGFANPEEAINQKTTFSQTGKPSEIQGVFKNYYQRSPKEQYMPLIIRQDKTPENFLIKLNPTDPKVAIAGVEEAWREVYSGFSLEFVFLNDIYNAQYRQDKQFGSVVLLFTMLSILIAFLGLFGLSSFMILLRTKEIGVRNVLGASRGSIVWELSKSFLIMVGTAGLLALPLSYWFIGSWLENYSIRIALGWELFIYPLLLILTLAALTVGFQTLKSALANPIQSLKNE